MKLKDVQTKIHEYFLESEQQGLKQSKVRSKGDYPNAILLTKNQYSSLLREMFKLTDDADDSALFNIKILSIEGLQVIFTDFIEEPKVLRLTKDD